MRASNPLSPRTFLPPSPAVCRCAAVRRVCDGAGDGRLCHRAGWLRGIQPRQAGLPRAVQTLLLIIIITIIDIDGVIDGVDNGIAAAAVLVLLFFLPQPALRRLPQAAEGLGGAGLCYQHQYQ